MSKELSEYIKKVIAHLIKSEPDRVYNEDENITLYFITNGAEQHGVTAEMLSYMEEHPMAMLEDLDQYYMSLIPPIEIVDDDELTDEERAEWD